jgi:WhiB family redox-sensing transcriptional regulator
MGSWVEFAACRGMNPDCFHPHPGDKIREAAAKKVCEACPARQACLDYAVTTGQTRGVWGGTTEAERRRARRAMRAALGVAS